MSVTVRDAHDADAERVSDLLGELGYPVPPTTVSDRLQRLADRTQHRVLVAELDGSVVGLLGLSRQEMLHLDKPIARVTTAVVGPEARQMGVGRCLMEAAREVAEAWSCDRLEVTTGLRREDAHRFYKALGFERRSYGYWLPA